MSDWSGRLFIAASLLSLLESLIRASWDVRARLDDLIADPDVLDDGDVEIESAWSILLAEPGEVSLNSMLVEIDKLNAVRHGDPGASNIRTTATGQVGLLDWDESRVDVTWHDLSNLGVSVLDQDEHQRARALSDAWEAANAWTAEPDYASTRIALLKQHRNT